MLLLATTAPALAWPNQPPEKVLISGPGIEGQVEIKEPQALAIFRLGHLEDFDSVVHSTPHGNGYKLARFFYGGEFDFARLTYYSDPSSQRPKGWFPMFSKQLIALVLVLGLLTAGWIAYQATIAAATPATVNVTVTANEYRYDPATIRVKRGQTVNLTFRNASTSMVHELRLKPFLETKAGPGLAFTESFVASIPGTYKFICIIPGHEAMVGEFVVE